MASAPNMDLKITRHQFPDDFVWGCASSAYQVEGAYNAAGKCLSNWDCLTLRHPEQIEDGSNGSEATDQYHRYKEDVMLIKKLGLQAYRFSISWSRLLMGGRVSTGVSEEGLQYYNNLINFCLEQGIEPYVTLFHFDIPQCLEDEYGGFLSTRIIQDFAEFAEVCFFQFGDRVKYWFTMNEMWTYVHHAYIAGYFPPNHGVTTPDVTRILNSGVVEYRTYRRSDAAVTRALSESAGDPSTEPYTAAHNMLLAHATAVDLYRKKYQAAQGGKIGIVNMSTWFEPHTDSAADKAAAERALDFMWGWFTSPVVHGDYPQVMREIVGKRLPKFTYEQEQLVKGSYDFIGLNYYTSNYVSNFPTPPNTKPTYYTDTQVLPHFEKDGVPIGPNPGSEWLFIVPRGLTALLNHTKEEYENPLIFITENGLSDRFPTPITVTEALKDDTRVNYFQDHLLALRDAMDNGVNVKAYFLWSIMDNFEWAEGYTSRFGIYYVDFLNGLKRHPKTSAVWWMNFLNVSDVVTRQKRQLTMDIEEQPARGSAKRLRSGGRA